MIKGIVERSFWQEGDPINIITACTHSGYESEWVNALPELNVYSMVEKGTVQGWVGSREKPSRYVVLPTNAGLAGIPKWIKPHLVLCQNVGAQQFLFQVAQYYGVPCLNLVHTYPWRGITPQQVEQYKQLPAFWHLFITEDSRKVWGFEQFERSSTLYHGIDDSVYNPVPLDRDNNVLTVVNEFAERWECGFPIYQQVVQGFPWKHFGSSSSGRFVNNPTQNFDQLLSELNRCGVYLNTAIWSPVSRALVEAAFMGCPIVSVAACDVPNIFTHEHDILLFDPNKPEDGRRLIQKLLTDKDYAQKLGANARETAKRVFSVNRFRAQWRDIFRKAILEG